MFSLKENMKRLNFSFKVDMKARPEIDGKVIINDLNGRHIQIGQMVKVEVTEVLEYDLIGQIVSIQ